MKTLSYTLVIFSGALLLLFSCSGDRMDDLSSGPKLNREEEQLASPLKEEFLPSLKLPHIQGELIVKTRNSLDPTTLKAVVTGIQRGLRIRQQQGLAKALSFRAIKNVYHLAADSIDSQDAISSLLSELRKDPEVIYAEPNYIYQASKVPQDPFFSSKGTWLQTYEDLWGVKQIQAGEAWDLAIGKGIVVAVSDTGVDYSHPDMGLIWVNPGEDLNKNGIADPTDFDGVDSDNNGFIDDLRGWDFTTCQRLDFNTGICLQSKLTDNNPIDDNGHGTHVSGTIAAAGDNNLGIVGIAYGATIMAVKGLNSQGAGSTVELAQSIIYAADQGARIINMSWGGPKSQMLKDALTYAHTKGVVLVAASGNEGANIGPADSENSLASNPSNFLHSVSVGSVDQLDQRSGFSNFGQALSIVAPGGGDTSNPDLSVNPNSTYHNILSLLATGTENNFPTQLRVGEMFLRIVGTSMAAPHVAGVAALVLSKNPSLNSREVKAILQNSADDLGSPGFDIEYGYGRLNAFRAVSQALATLPNSPPVLNVTQNLEVHEEEEIKFIVSALDSDGDPISLSASNLPPGASFTHEDGTFAWTPARGQGGTSYTIIFEANDQRATDQKNLTITVLPLIVELSSIEEPQIQQNANTFPNIQSGCKLGSLDSSREFFLYLFLLFFLCVKARPQNKLGNQ